ncbi:hypothetical protein TSOC_012727 [Tetrabaena socialis]|uniref:Uncharacterized protein n=1 Tax=Tetrabaena socialis TaxID=47790 RepID=A0A2J7ZM98_9CHLO|nr:hypothetical protein TSOC_012727 [Tetrabaena socialis]|eukprot:PNH01393.1 hypothetical protein TSOC_012727 [Tetrabaena socialis]
MSGRRLRSILAAVIALVALQPVLAAALTVSAFLEAACAHGTLPDGPALLCSLSERVALQQPPVGARVATLAGTTVVAGPAGAQPGAAAALDLSASNASGSSRPLLALGANATLLLRDLALDGAALVLPSPLSAPLPLAQLLGLRAVVPQNVRITTPSCVALSVHQAAACRALAPSPHLTVAPGLLRLRQWSSPSLTAVNVTLTCAGPPAPHPCVAVAVGSGQELVDVLYGAYGTPAAVASGQPVPPTYIMVTHDVTLAAAIPSDFEPGGAFVVTLKFVKQPLRLVLQQDALMVVGVVANLDTPWHSDFGQAQVNITQPGLILGDPAGPRLLNVSGRPALINLRGPLAALTLRDLVFAPPGLWWRYLPEGSPRPAALPRTTLDGVVLLVPYRELRLLAWCAAHNSTAPLTDPGVAEEVAAMLAGSQLVAPGLVRRQLAAAEAASYSGGGGGESGDTGGTPSSPSPLRSITFWRFNWCGLYGRNVTLASWLPYASAAPYMAATTSPLELPDRWGPPAAVAPSPLHPEPAVPGTGGDLAAAEGWNGGRDSSSNSNASGLTPAVVVGIAVAGLAVLLAAVTAAAWLFHPHLAVARTPGEGSSSEIGYSSLEDQPRRTKTNTSTLAHQGLSQTLPPLRISRQPPSKHARGVVNCPALVAPHDVELRAARAGSGGPSSSGGAAAAAAAGEAAITASMAHPNLVACYTFELVPLRVQPQEGGAEGIMRAGSSMGVEVGDDGSTPGWRSALAAVASSQVAAQLLTRLMAKVCDFGLSQQLGCRRPGTAGVLDGDRTHVTGPRSSAYSAPELVRHGHTGYKQPSDFEPGGAFVVTLKFVKQPLRLVLQQDALMVVGVVANLDTPWHSDFGQAQVNITQPGLILGDPAGPRLLNVSGRPALINLRGPLAALTLRDLVFAPPGLWWRYLPEGSPRPAALPRTTLDGVVLLVPYRELRLLAWCAAHNSTAPLTDPGVAEEVAAMLAGSQLVAPGLVRRQLAAAEAASYSGGGGGESGDTGGTPSSPSPLRSITFWRFNWCGLYGRNVTLASWLPYASAAPYMAATTSPLELPDRWGPPAAVAPSPLHPEPAVPGTGGDLAAAEGWNGGRDSSSNSNASGLTPAVVVGIAVAGLAVLLAAVTAAAWLFHPHLAVARTPGEGSSSEIGYSSLEDQPRRTKTNTSTLAHQGLSQTLPPLRISRQPPSKHARGVVNCPALVAPHDVELRAARAGSGGPSSSGGAVVAVDALVLTGELGRGAQHLSAAVSSAKD